MPWKGLRLGGGHESNGSKRHSVFDPLTQSRHSEHLPRPSPPPAQQLDARHSESTFRPSAVTAPEADKDGDDERGPVRRLVSHESLVGKLDKDHVRPGPPLRKHRFSFMRLRHASDPQLSASYAKAERDAPPVPSLPPPTIITTAPTSHELDQPVKRKPKHPFRPKSAITPTEELSSNRPTGDMCQAARLHDDPGSSSDRPGAESNLAMSRASHEEPGRLSTTSMRSGGGRDQPIESLASSMTTDARFSESSRSDQSMGDRSFARALTPLDDAGPVGKRFRMPRFRRNRSPLFPLPPRVIPADSSGGISADRSSASLSRGTSAALTPMSTTADGLDDDHVSPLPSPPRSSLGANPVPPLLRRDSSRSARSAHSSSSQRGLALRSGRDRSSTVGSLTDFQDEHQNPSPRGLASGRTSTSTSGRKSFGDLFSISQRLRQNSEPSNPRSGSPARGAVGGGPGTPTSKPGSFSIARDVPSFPRRDEDDTPASYLARLQDTVPSGSIAAALAQSDDEFFKTALRKYMRGFLFFGDPIDMAIRKLLMEVELPKETQQIDRVLQGFADRYHECNPGIFASTDQAYFIAFSILILHTDVFNKNNKRKMQKSDYVKNTRGEGVAAEILECFYENISYTPFIHVEDVQISAKHLPRPRRNLFKSSSSEHLSRVAKEPVDPYALILDGKLDTLRPSLKDVMDLDDPYSCYGTFGPPNMNTLHDAFARASTLQIVSARSRPDAFLTPSSIDNPADSHPGLVDIKVAKVGLLWRKDPKKKRGRSPWQEWGALLTFSQLYFFRDVHWVKSLIAQQDANSKGGRRRPVVFKPPLTEFKPDGIMSTEQAVALLDARYRRHKHAFVFVRNNSLEEVFLANTEAEMNDWLAKLNYAAAFRTTGVRTNGMIATNYEAQRQRQRLNRMSSHLSEQSLQSIDKEPVSPTIDDAQIAPEVREARTEQINQKVREANEKMFVGQTQLEDLLRNARHLQVLTPVHNRAREQVIMAAGRVSAKLKWVRQDIWRTRCYREILVRDMGGEIPKTFQEERAAFMSPSVSASTLASAAAPATGSVDRAPSQGQASASVTTPSIPVVEEEGTEAGPSTSSATPDASAIDARRPSMPSSMTSSEVPRLGRRSSADTVTDRAKSHSPPPQADSLERQASVLSSGSRMDILSITSQGSKAIGPPSSLDRGEDHEHRRGASDMTETSLPQDPTINGNNLEERSERPESIEAPSTQGDQTSSSSKNRHSLHRSLRETYHARTNSQHRAKKARDSMSSVAPTTEDESPTPAITSPSVLIVETEGLSRKTPNFTLHGKKASVITFGSEWQNMSPEERLKARKPNPAAAAAMAPCTATDAGIGPGPDGNGTGTESVVAALGPLRADERPQSLRSTSVSVSAEQATSDEPQDMANGSTTEVHSQSVDAVGEPGPEVEASPGPMNGETMSVSVDSVQQQQEMSLRQHTPSEQAVSA